MDRSRYKPLFLFSAALILPSIVIGVLAWKNVTQDRELGEKRRMEAEKRTLAGIRQNVLARLERIKLQEITTASPATTASTTGAYSDPAVLLVGLADRDWLVLPWDVDPNAERLRQFIREPAFASKIQDAERAELVEKTYDRAAGLYRESIRAAEAARNSS